MLLGSVLLIVGSVMFLATQGTEWKDSFFEVDMNGEMKSVELPACSAVCLSWVKPVYDGTNPPELSKHKFSFRGVDFEVTEAAPGAASPSLTLASGLEKFMTTSVDGDTLFIRFLIPDDMVPEEFEDDYWIKVRSERMTLAIPKRVGYVENKLEGLDTDFNALDRGTFSFYTYRDANVNDCKFASLYATSDLGRLNLNSGEVENLYLDLDDCRNWGVDETFHIDTEHLTGSNRSTNHLQRGECRRVIWTPKTEDAVLELELHQAGTFVVN